ncbi:hypothetical protein GCM10027403_17320 [Arthrobacter tecti]
MITASDTTFASMLAGTNLAVHGSGTSAIVMGDRIEAASPAELRSQLSAAIYTNLHIRHPGIEGQTDTVQDADLIAQLCGAVPHQQIVQAVTESDVQASLGPGHRTVMMDRLKVLVADDKLVRDDSGVVVGARFSSWRTRTTPGYVLALSQRSISAGPVVRLYLARDSVEQTLAVWSLLLRGLDEAGIAYQAKALSSIAAHPRADAVVVYTARQDLAAAAEATTHATKAAPSATLPPSVFTRRLTNDVTTAYEPVDPRPAYQRLSFGQHRSRVLADALIRAAAEGRTVTSTWEEEAHAALIDPHTPGRNLNS